MPTLRLPHRRLRWLAVVLVPWLAWRLGCAEQPAAPPPESLAEGRYAVQRVIDGDTLLLANGARVRLLGVDTPETVRPEQPPQPWGAEASEFTRQFLSGGTVELRMDRERQDRYGRFLCYVWVDQRHLNAELLSAGLARLVPYAAMNESTRKHFRQCEQQARQNRLGLWSAPAAAPPGPGAPSKID